MFKSAERPSTVLDVYRNDYSWNFSWCKWYLTFNLKTDLFRRRFLEQIQGEKKKRKREKALQDLIISYLFQESVFRSRESVSS